jgi:translation initiation factor IF-2
MSASGVVIESQFQKGQGATASVLITKGTLRVGDNILAGTSWGRVKSMTSDTGKSLEEAGPSIPVQVFNIHNIFYVTILMSLSLTS